MYWLKGPIDSFEIKWSEMETLFDDGKAKHALVRQNSKSET